MNFKNVCIEAMDYQVAVRESINLRTGKITGFTFINERERQRAKHPVMIQQDGKWTVAWNGKRVAGLTKAKAAHLALDWAVNGA